LNFLDEKGLARRLPADVFSIFLTVQHLKQLFQKGRSIPGALPFRHVWLQNKEVSILEQLFKPQVIAAKLMVQKSK